MGESRSWDGEIVDKSERKEVRTVLLRWLLLETRVGERLLCFLEERAGLAVVRADWLGAQRSGRPIADSAS
jgi:hypothetical protein